VCYSCGHHGDVFELVRLVLDVDFESAVKFVADICGGEEYYECNEDTWLRKGFITKREQELIGIHDSPVYIASDYTTDFDEAKEARENGMEISCDMRGTEHELDGYIISEISVASPLFRLFRDDPAEYRRLIDECCQRKIGAIDFAFELLKNPESCSSLSLQRLAVKINSLASLDELYSFFKQKYSEIIDIANRHGNGVDEKTYQEINTKLLSYVANNIWEKEVVGAF